MAAADPEAGHHLHQAAAAHAPAQPAPRAPVAAMKTVGRGGAARKVETAEEAWDEF